MRSSVTCTVTILGSFLAAMVMPGLQNVVPLLQIVARIRFSS